MLGPMSQAKVNRQLDLGLIAAGIYGDSNGAVYWDGRNFERETLSSGIYFYQFEVW